MQLSVFFAPAYAQSTTNATNTKTWFVWLNSAATINGKDVQLVSEKPMAITCCLQSARYRKFVRQTEKWLAKNFSAKLKAPLELSKIQNKELANEMVDRAQKNKNVKIIDYKFNCK